MQKINKLKISPQLVSGSSGTEQQDEKANAPDSTDVGRGDGYTEGIPGPVTRLFVLANRGLSNLIQDLILVRIKKVNSMINYFDGVSFFAAHRPNERTRRELQSQTHHIADLRNEARLWKMLTTFSAQSKTFSSCHFLPLVFFMIIILHTHTHTLFSIKLLHHCNDFYAHLPIKVSIIVNRFWLSCHKLFSSLWFYFLLIKYDFY